MFFPCTHVSKGLKQFGSRTYDWQITYLGITLKCAACRVFEGATIIRRSEDPSKEKSPKLLKYENSPKSSMNLIKDEILPKLNMNILKHKKKTQIMH